MELDKNNRTINGVITDVYGNYTIRITNPNNKIAFSFIGFKAVTEDINSRKVINVSLETEDVQIQAVEIVAKRVSDGFLNIEERNLTTSVQRLASTEIEYLQVASIDEAMQGRLAGVDIVASSGDPGAGMSIRIRGTTSINSSSEPLIVLNGIPYETEIDKDFDFAAADEIGYAQMLNISPDDIKEITVLKDAAATAVWGSRAANGVLMITTKRGSLGKPRADYSYKFTIAKQPDAIPMLNGDQYSMMILEGYMNKNGVPFPADNKELWYDPTWEHYWDYNQNTNWIDAVTRTGYTNDHNFSLSGGGEKARYRVSVGYLDQTGTTLGTSLKRLSTMLNLDYNVSDKIFFNTDLIYTRGDNDRNYPDIDKNEYKNKSVREIAYKKMPNMSIYVRDEEGNPTDLYFSPESNIQGSWSTTYNPVAMADKGMYNILSNRIIPKFGLRYDILDHLRYNFDVAFDINNEKRKSFLPQDATGKPWTDPNVNKAGDKDNDIFIVQTFNKLYYQPNLGDKHNLMMLASFTTYDKVNYVYQSNTSNTSSSELQDPSIDSRIVNAEGLGINSGKSQNRSIAALFTFNYSFLDRYILSGSIRRDGSSKFGSGKRFGNFPSISARWRISDEAFMQQFQFIDDLSVRASYGENGNAPGKSYTQFNNYSTFDWNYLGESAMYSKTMELVNKKWETTIQKNLGFNLILFNNRIDIDVDIYNKRTKDLFFEELKIPTITGFDEIGMNAGVMDNRGWEINVMSGIIRISDFSVDFNFNIARNQNIIREISELHEQISGNIGNGEYLERIQIDNPIGSFYGYRFKGVYIDEEATIAKDADGNQILDINGNPVYMTFNYPYTDYIFQPGDAMYEDINYDGNINAFDIVYLGDANPLFTGGFGPIIRYKAISVNMFFHYRYGNDIVNKARMEIEKMYNYDNQSTAVLRRWRHEGDETDIPRALINGGYNWLGSDRFVEDGSFIRFKHLSILYTLPKALIQKFNITNAKIGLTASNLWTWTNYTGQDPEISFESNKFFEIGHDKSVTPRSREITFHINFSF
jgi:TonB-linked SusC/RagA family outer membrane protein